MTRVAVLALLLLSVLAPATAWDNDDLEIFDLVELINKNFYEQMGLKQVRIRYVDETIYYLSPISLSNSFFVGCNTSRDQKGVQRPFHTAPSGQKQGRRCRHPVQEYGLDVRSAERSSEAGEVRRSFEERTSQLEVGALLLPQGQKGRTS